MLREGDDIAVVGGVLIPSGEVASVDGGGDDEPYSRRGV